LDAAPEIRRENKYILAQPIFNLNNGFSGIAFSEEK
jgi:hypothetical protein